VAGGADKAAALREAQLARMKAWATAGRPTHPLLWAGLTFNGR
jgi:hypothetical protein